MPVTFTTTLPNLSAISLSSSSETSLSASWQDVLDNGGYRVEWRQSGDAEWYIDPAAETIIDPADSTTNWFKGSASTISTVSSPSRDGTAIASESTSQTGNWWDQTARLEAGTTWDLSGEVLQFWFYSEATTGDPLTVEFKDSNGNKNSVPITGDESATGKWIRGQVSPPTSNYSGGNFDPSSIEWVRWGQNRQSGEYLYLDIVKSGNTSWSNSVTSTTIENLTYGNEYEIRVRTQTPHSTGSWVTDSTTLKLPAPSNVSLGTTVEDEVSISWTRNDSSPDGTWEIYMSTDGSRGSMIYSSSDLTTTTHTETGLTDGKTYYFTVARVKSGVPSDSDQQSGTSFLPSASSLTVNAPTEGEMEITWTRNDDNSTGSWEIFASTDGSLGSSIGTVASITTTTFTHSNLKDGEKYYYTVRRITNDSQKDSTQNSGITVLPSPSSISITSTDSTSGSLSWIVNQDYGSTKVQYRRSSNSSWKDFSTGLSLSQTTETVSNLLNGEKYDVRVVAVTEHSNSPSSITTFTTTVPDVGQPTLDVTVNEEITVNWIDSINYGEYLIQVREYGEGDWSNTAAGFAETTDPHDGATTVTFSGMKDGEKYEVRMRTQTEHATGSWTSPISDTTILPSPDSIAASTVSSTEVEITWTSNTSDGESRILRSMRHPEKGWLGYERVDAVSPSPSSYSDTNANPGREYRYKIENITDHATSQSSGYGDVKLPAEFPCGRGGIVHALGDYNEIFEITMDGDWVRFGAVRLDSDTDVTLNLDDQYRIEGTVKHITGDAVIRFGLFARQPNATADVKFENLAPESWYRFQFDHVLAKTATGRAHGETNQNGVIQFNKVEVPHE